MNFEYQASGRPYALQPYQYQSTFVPADLGVIQQNLAARQQRYDAANAAWGETKAKLYDDPTYDNEAKQEVVKQIEGNFENIYKTYNGDLGAATSDLMQMIAGHRKSDYFRLNKVALEKQKQFEALKQAYGAEGLEFKGMKPGLRNPDGSWKKQEDFDFDVVKDLPRDEKLASIIDQSLQQVSREGEMEMDSKTGLWKSKIVGGKGYLQDKNATILEEYKATPEGKLHMRILKEINGSKNVEGELKEYVDRAIANRKAPESIKYDYQQPVKSNNNGKGKNGNSGITFNSSGQVIVQHPDFNAVNSSSTLSRALNTNPNSIPLTKLNTRISSSDEYKKAQKNINFSTRNAWTYIKNRFKNANLNDFPELKKVIEDSESVYNTSELNADLIRLYKAIASNDYNEATKHTNLEIKSQALGALRDVMPTIGTINPFTLPYLNAKSDEFAELTDVAVEKLTEPMGIRSSDPALIALKGAISSTKNINNVVNTLIKSPEYQQGNAISLHMADELNEADNPEQYAANKKFNDAMPKYMLNAIDEGLLINDNGTTATKADFPKLSGPLSPGDMSIGYDRNGNIYFVVTGLGKKEGEVTQKTFSFNESGQNSSIAEEIYRKLDEDSGYKITKLRSARYEPVEGTNYIIDKNTAKKIKLKEGYSINSNISEDGYTLEKEVKDKNDKITKVPVTYFDYTKPKNNEERLFVYINNFPHDPANISGLSKENAAKKAEEYLKTVNVSFETGDEILKYTKEN